MRSKVVEFILLFLGAVAAQVLIFDNIQAGGFLNPYFYLIFLLLLPIQIPRGALLILGFLLGLTIDFFSSTLGLNAAACTLAAYIRPFVLKGVLSHSTAPKIEVPSLFHIGFAATLKYTVALVAIHHIVLFLLAASSRHIGITLLRIAINVGVTSISIILAEFFLFTGQPARAHKT